MKELILLNATCDEKEEGETMRGAGTSPLSYVPMIVTKVLIERIAEIGDKSKRF